MKEIARCYYLKNGRLDLSVLEEVPIRSLVQEDKENMSSVQEAKVYIDESIESIFAEMGSYFMQEEKEDRNT